MAEASAVGSSAEVKWFFLDGSSQHIGPYDAATMQGGAFLCKCLPELLAKLKGSVEVSLETATRTAVLDL